MQFAFQFRDLLQRNFQSHEIASISRRLAQSARGPLKIADRFQASTKTRQQIGFVQQIGDQLLAAFELVEIAQRLQNPAPQFPSAHRRDRAIERREQAHVPRAARFDQLEVHLRGGVEHHEIVPRIATQRRQVVHLPPQLLLQVMDDRAGRTDRRRHFGATKTVQRFDPEMFAQGKAGVIGQEREVVVSQRPRDLAELVHLPFAHQNFRWRNPREIVEEPAAVFRFGQAEFARAQFRVGKTEFAFMKINRAQIIRPVGLQQIQLAHRSRRDDLGDLARDDFPRLRLAGLIADRHAPPGLDELGDVTLGGVIRHAAHRDAVAMSEGEVQQSGGLLGVLEKQLVEVAEPKEQERIRRHGRAQPLVLLHHRGQRVGHGFRMESPGSDCEPELE